MISPRPLLAATAITALAIAGATTTAAETPPTSEPPPASEPPTATTTTSTSTTTTSTTTTSTTTPTPTSTSTSPASTPSTPPELVTVTATPGCYSSQAIAEIEVTALEDVSGGVIRFGGISASDVGFSALATGESLSMIYPGDRLSVEVFTSAAQHPGEIDRVDVDVPACPPSPTAPIVSAEVERCATDEDGAIAVTTTNPVGGPEDDLNFVLRPVTQPDEDEYWHYSSLLIEPGINEADPPDGGQIVVVVDELMSFAGTRGLAAGDYVIEPRWSVEYPRDPAITTGFLGGAGLGGDPIFITLPACEATPFLPTTVRVASFDAELSGLVGDESVPGSSMPAHPQAAEVAEIIQRVRPEVLVLDGFDGDSEGEAFELFATSYLAVAHGDAEPIEYPYSFTAAGGGGAPSVLVVLSRYPILTEEVRTFQTLPWAAIPDNRLPTDPETSQPVAEVADLPLSSGAHWDVPVDVDGTVLHVLATATTEPVDETTAARNADEIGLWAHYVAGDDTDWIDDDDGVTGGLDADAEFVIVGNLNADAAGDGNAVPGAIRQLLDLDAIHDPRPASDGAVEAAEVQAGANTAHHGDPALDTADLPDEPGPGNLRLDYVLPSTGLDVVDAGVFWPTSDDPLATLVTGDDHHLVWIDLTVAASSPR